MSIVILTAPEDVTADLVVSRLAEAGAAFHRVALDDEITVTGTPGSITIEDAYRRTTNPEAVYWRRPGPVETEQSKALVGLLLAAPVRRWVNHPAANDRARHKPGQLTAATACGFNVPETLITSSPEHISQFQQRHPETIQKPLHQVPNDFIWLGNGMIYQSMIDKVCDIRLTVVGDRLFSCRITSEHLDWRPDDAAVYEPVPTPEPVEKSVRAYMDHFDLSFGAFDFAVDADGRWWFLECNPNGNWGFVEIRANIDISTAVARLLMGQAS